MNYSIDVHVQEEKEYRQRLWTPSSAARGRTLHPHRSAAGDQEGDDQTPTYDRLSGLSVGGVYVGILFGQNRNEVPTIGMV